MTNREEFAGCMSVIGIAQRAEYNSTEKAIKALVVTDDGSEFKIEIPYTHFTFRLGMDIDVEMEKTAVLMRGKKIEIISTARPKSALHPGI